LLSEERCSVSQIPEDRFATARYIHPNRTNPGKSVNFYAGVLDDIFGFDANFFGMSPREAVQTDPQQRLLLQVVWESLEQAGIPPSSLAGSPVGVFVGASSLDYQLRFILDPLSVDTQSMTGNTLSIISNRISYQLDLKGPSFTVDTACSSSLVAFNQACNAIASGVIDTAIVAGVNILGSPFPFVGFSRAFMLSASGRCRAFDATGDGYVRGEGAVAIVIQSTKAARRSNRFIQADVVGWGTNSDGRTVGLSMPSPQSQFDLLQQVYQRFELDPNELAFVEAHGTGTRVGDPVEADAIGKSLGVRRTAPLLIGSVKTNIGHLEPASGLAGLLKALLSLKKKVLPASLHFKTPNPDIPFETLNLQVAATAHALEDHKRQLAGINSFGFGGSNAHVVLRQSEPAEINNADSKQIVPLVISARSPEALREVALRLSDAVRKADAPSLGAVANAAAYDRDHLEHRAIILPSIPGEMISALTDVAEGRSPKIGILGRVNQRDCKVAFAFSGNGSQWVGMGRAAFKMNRQFRQSFKEVDRIFSELADWSLVEMLQSDDLEHELQSASVAQALLFAIQVAVVNGLKYLGIEPSVVFGHSAGEVAAAWSAGALTLDEAIRVIHSRSACQETARGKGGMAAVVISKDEAEELLLGEEYAGLEIAAINTGRSITISGGLDVLDRFMKHARKQRWPYRRLPVEYAYHSHFADPVETQLLGLLQGLSCSPGNVPFVSSVYGQIVKGNRLDANYWWENVRRTVDFKSAAETVVALGADMVIEIGPSPVLTGYMADVFKETGSSVAVLPSLDRKDPEDQDPILRAASRAFAHGATISMKKVFGPRLSGGTTLPHYPWQNTQYRLEPSVEQLTTMAPAIHPLLGVAPRQGDTSFYNHIDTEAFPWLLDHKIEGAIVFPGTAILEMALAAARETLGEGPLELRGCAIFRPLVLEAGAVRETLVRVSPDEGLIDLLSRPRGSDSEWLHHARTRFCRPPALADEIIASPLSVLPSLQADEVYELMQSFRFDYGPAFRRLVSVQSDGNGSALVRLSDAPLAWPPFLLDPTVADSALHGALFTLFQNRKASPNGKSFVPTRIDSLRLYQPGRTVCCCRVDVSGDLTASAIANLTFLADDQSVVAVAKGGRFTEVQLSGSDVPGAFYRTVAVPLPTTSVMALQAKTFSPMAAMRSSELVTSHAPERGDVLLLIEAASRAIAYHAFKSLFGLESFFLDEPDSGKELKPHLRHLAERILRDLTADGMAVQEHRGWKLAPEPALPPVSQLIQSLLALDAQRSPEATYLSYLSSALTEILAADHQPPVPGPSLIEALATASAANQACSRALAKAVSAIAGNWPAAKSLNILIVGGSGTSMIRGIAESVPLEVGTVTVSDFNEERFNRTWGGVESKPGVRTVAWAQLDSKDGPQFDLVVGAQLFRQKGEASTVLAKMKELICDEGALIFIEPTSSIFIDLLCLLQHNPSSKAEVSAISDFDVSSINLARTLTEAGFGSVEIENLVSDQTEALVVSAIAKSGLRAGSAQTDHQHRHIAVVDCDNSEFGGELRRILQEAANNGEPGGSVSTESVVKMNGSIADPQSAPNELILLATGNVGDDPSAALATRCGAITKALKSFDGRDGVLWIVAPGAMQAFHGSIDAIRPESSALWGFGRVACNEYSNVDIRLMDVDPNIPVKVAAKRVLVEVNLRRDERELLIADNGTFGLRLVESEGATGIHESRLDDVTSRLDIDGRGSLDRLKWRSVARIEPGAGQVEIQVAATGVNFRDVMWALGLLPQEALESGFAGPTLGMECSGVISRVGAGVSRLAVGQRCVAFAPAAFAEHVVVPEFAVARMPDGIDPEAAATIPVAFLTAFYSLKHLARLAKGETVLIHGGAGGVGLAAIQIAKWIGAVPIATAGSVEKQALLRELGVQHVLHSRSLGFLDEVMKITSGRGVDVVLNSLAGEAMERSIECLGTFGRFIELGKRDFFADTRVGLRPFRRNLSYFGVDADQLLSGQNDLAQRMFTELLELFDQHAISPLPHRSFDGVDVTAAFRLMQQAGHVGKLVVRPARSRAYAPGMAPLLKCHADGTYVIVGGFGGFGLALAQRLAKRGARHIVLIGRRGARTADIRQAISKLRDGGVSVYEEMLDAADGDALTKLFARLSLQAPTIRGVFHAAMTLDDALIENLSAKRIEPVLRSKIKVAILLDQLTRTMNLDHFVLFSSATTMIGNPGQASYVAANAFLEGLAQQRRANGLPAVAVAWGAISDAGYLARTSAENELLNRRFAKNSVKVDEALDALEQILQGDQTDLACATIGFGRFDWTTISKELPIASTALFAYVRKKSSADAGQSVGRTNLVEELTSLAPEKARQKVVEILAAEIGRILRIGSTQIDCNKPLSDIGLDSLMGVELRLSAEERLGVEVPLMSIGGAGSLNDLAARIVKLVREKGNLNGNGRSATSDLIHIHANTNDEDTGEMAAIAAAIEKGEAAVKRLF